MARDGGVHEAADLVPTMHYAQGRRHGFKTSRDTSMPSAYIEAPTDQDLCMGEEPGGVILPQAFVY